MQEFEIAIELLNEIIDQDIYFEEALKKKFQSNVEIRPLRGKVATLVGCELRHSILFGYLLNPIKELDEADKRVISLVLANAYFSKNFDQALLVEALKQKIGEEKLALIQPLLDKAGDPKGYIPEDISKTSNRFFSLRFNTPEWALKIWQHYGYGKTYKLLRQNSKQPATFVRVRDDIKAPEEIVIEDPSFKSTGTINILRYEGKNAVRRHPLHQNQTIFIEKPATKMILSKVKAQEGDEVLLFNGNKDSSPLKEMIISYSRDTAINLGVYDFEDYGDVRYMIKQGKYRNVNFFAGQPDSIESAISRPQNLVVVCPNSTNFDQVSQYPDFFLHFKKEKMDKIIAEEGKMLESLSQYVAEGGTLLYMVYTISKKEGHQTIQNFLLAHPEFKMVEEEQLFPDEGYATCMFYAILKKETPLAKAEPPLIEASLTQGATTVMRAEGK